MGLAAHREYKQPADVRFKAAERQRRFRQKKRGMLLAEKAKKGELQRLPGLRRSDIDIDKLAAWSAKRLRVPSGRLQAQPFELQPWQVDFLRGALAPGVMEAALSVARKNGKSGLIAALLLGCLDGPLRVRGWRGIVCSMTGRLAAELLGAMESIARASALPGIKFKRSPQPGQVTVEEHDIVLDFLAADKASGHAVGADIAIIDEAGLLGEDKRALWNAMLTSVSGRDGRLICISIRGEGPMFAELLARGAEPHVHAVEFAAPPGCALDDRAGWLAANPGLKHGIKSPEYMERAAKRALASPGDQAAFRAYDLNQPQEPEREMIVSLSDWRRCVAEGQAAPPRRGECALGVDIGGSASMTAAVAYWPESGRYECWGAFPATPDLAQRGENDAVGGLYLRMRERGELTVYPGRVTDAACFIDECASRLAGQKVRMAADRYRRAEVLEAMSRSFVTDWPVEWRGQGHSHTADGSRDVRAFQRAVLGAKWIGARSLMMEQAIAQSSIARDGAGNPKLLRAKSTGRIDALQAGVLAAGLGERMAAAPSGGRRYRGLA
ncbi:MAG: terminase large subunit [Chloroflexi bacterium]|nr:terminase large subunit [Chloroflexota bacterium]